MCTSRIYRRLNNLHQRASSLYQQINRVNIRETTISFLHEVARGYFANEPEEAPYRTIITASFLVIALLQPRNAVPALLIDLPFDDRNDAPQNNEEAKPIPLNKNQQALNEIDFPTTFIPEEYICLMTTQIMDDPVLVPCGNAAPAINDRAFMTKWITEHKTNPYNRQPLDIADLKEATELKQQIDYFVKKVVSEIKKVKETKTAPLAPEEYKKISDVAYEQAKLIHPINKTEPPVDSHSDMRMRI